MTKVTIHAAKTQLSKLIERACKGEEIVIARGDEPVVRLVLVTPAPRGRVFGAMRGKARVDEAFFEPLPAEELAAREQ
jgi:antitoxin (DNA-binding transcriptional repressor) of toxin-antitoxin stability system